MILSCSSLFCVLTLLVFLLNVYFPCRCLKCLCRVSGIRITIFYQMPEVQLSHCWIWTFDPGTWSSVLFFLSFESSSSTKHVLTVAKNVLHIDCWQVRFFFVQLLLVLPTFVHHTWQCFSIVLDASPLLCISGLNWSVPEKKKNSCNIGRFIVALSIFFY